MQKKWNEPARNLNEVVMGKSRSTSFRAGAMAITLLISLGQPAMVLATVEELTLSKVPPDTKVTIIGADRSDRVEARTKAGDSEGKLSFQLKDRGWESGKYILNIWEPVGSPIGELISLEDGANHIDLTTILGEPMATDREAAPNAGVAGGLAGAVASGIALSGRSGDAGIERRGEYGYGEEERGSRGGGRGAAAGMAVGGALLGALANSLFGGSSSEPAPAAPATAPEPQTAGEFVIDRVIATIPLADLPAMQGLAQAIAADHNLTLIAVSGLASVNIGLAEYTITDGLDPLAKSAELAGDARVESAQPDFIYQTASKQEHLYYGRKLIRADVLPSKATGDGVRVALIDTGVDRERAELKGKIAAAVDFTGKGLTPDVHGTMLAGIIAAERNSGIGVAPNVNLLAIKSCQAQRPQRIEGTCWTSTLTRGIDYANTGSARVINLSVGGPQDKLLARLINEAVKRNIVVVAAAGNDGIKGQPRYPAALDNVIAVTAVDIDRQLYRQATRGNFIDLSAPGVEIVSVGPGARFPISSGTSFAAAYVTGTIALMLEQKSDLTPRETQARLEKAAADLGAPGKDDQFGSGLVDICQAMQQLEQTNPCR
jgi:Subtilase family